MNGQKPTCLGVLGAIAACFVSIWAAQFAAAGQPYALLVGINHYPNFPESDLHGAVNDVASVQRVLTREYRFSPDRVRVLSEERATLAAIRGEFADAAGKLQQDDVFVFYFCGHGVQDTDELGGDETDDHADEALCLRDSNPKAFGEKHLLVDDELDRLLTALPCRTVVVFLDCCYSGTATKSVNRVGRIRGLPRIGGPPPTTAATTPARPKAAPVLQRSDQQRIVFTACNERQKAWEIVPLGASTAMPGAFIGFDPKQFQRGLYTYHLLQGLHGEADSNADGLVSYREADTFVKQRLNAWYNGEETDPSERQSPVLEILPPGDVADTPLFGVRQKERFFARVNPAEMERVRLDAGAIHGLALNQVFGLFVQEATGAADRPPMAQVEIDKLGLDWAEARLIRGVRDDNHRIAAPLVNSVDVRTLLLQVRVMVGSAPLEQTVATDLKKALIARLAADKRFQISDNQDFDLQLTVEAKQSIDQQVDVAASWVQSNSRSYSPQVWNVSASEVPRQLATISQEIGQRAGQIADDLLLRHSLASLTNPAANFGMQVVVDRRPSDGSDLATYRKGEGLVLAMKSTADCWYYLLAIRPDGRAELWSAAGEDRRALAGQPYLFPSPSRVWALDGPPGVYVVKVIASRNVLPVGTITDGAVRYDVFRQLPPTDWAESSISFRVVSQ